MKTILTIACLQLIALSAFGQRKAAYTIFNANGKKVSYQKMIKKLAKGDVILFGELHNNPIAHWLQYEVTVDLNKENTVILGAEMIEADNQEQLNAYLNGEINAHELDSMARLWNNYKTDYAPLVDFAKDNKLAFVATNIPRRYARLVHYNGFAILDTLPQNEKNWMAPLPMAFDSELPTYKKILEMMGDHGTPQLVMAQATKDATMAHFILKNYTSGSIFIHYNGAFHSDYYEGILWYLQRENKDLKYKTISTVSQKNIKKLSAENMQKADFIICVDENMTTTY